MQPFLHTTLKVLGILTGCTGALASMLVFFRFQWPAPVQWLLKLYASALSPLFALSGLFAAFAGFATSSLFIVLMGTYVVVFFVVHIFRVTRPPGSSTGFEQAFGPQWDKHFRAEQKNGFLASRRVLTLPAVPNPRFSPNLSFATIPGTERELLCDVWQPPTNVKPSGLAFIYLHGGGWCLLDKDLATRPLFRHLAAQGHVIMDVAYRLAPETDMMGMVADVKRAIVWMKEHADTYGVNPDCIVVGGGSAGGHLACLAAFTATNQKFTPAELEGKDISVCAVVSIYGPSDLEAMYYHTNQHLTTRSTPGKIKKAIPAKVPAWIVKRMGENYHRLGFDKGFEKTTFAPLFGGHPDEHREPYVQFSTIPHVNPDCPPTLLIHGEHDIMAPVNSTRLLFARLVTNKVPTVMHIVPQSDHAFDLIIPKISPSSHNAVYDVERFLGLMAQQPEKWKSKGQVAEAFQLH